MKCRRGQFLQAIGCEQNGLVSANLAERRILNISSPLIRNRTVLNSHLVLALKDVASSDHLALASKQGLQPRNLPNQFAIPFIAAIVIFVFVGRTKGFAPAKLAISQSAASGASTALPTPTATPTPTRVVDIIPEFLWMIEELKTTKFKHLQTLGFTLDSCK
jgi:hypothetical protein